MGYIPSDVPRHFAKVFGTGVTPFRVDDRFAASIAPVLFFRNSRTLPVLKLVALRFRRFQSWELSFLILSDRCQDFPQTFDSLREPPSALHAVFPDAFVSLPLKDCSLNCLSWGFQISPLHRIETAGVHSRSPVSRFPSRKCVASAFLRSVPPVLHRFDGFLHQQPADVFQPASDPGVHRVSSCHEAELPAVPLLPSEAFPPLVATKIRVTAFFRWDSVTAVHPFGCRVHRYPFPSRSWRFCAFPRSNTEPQGLAPRGGSVAPTDRFQSAVPGAPLGFDQPFFLMPGFRRLP